MAYTLKKLCEDDCKTVLNIMNYFIENSFAAYNQHKIGPEIFQRFLLMAQGYPAVTMRDDDGTTIGFGFLHPYHPADSFRHTVEISYFIMPEHTNRGLGSLLLNSFIEEAQKIGIKNFMASISSLNEQSLKFHLKHGFTECGRFKDIGLKNGTPFDVVWMQKSIAE